MSTTMNRTIVKEEIIIKEEEVPFEFIEVSCEVEIDYQGECSSIAKIGENESHSDMRPNAAPTSDCDDSESERHYIRFDSDDACDTSETDGETCELKTEQGNKRPILFSQDNLKKTIDSRDKVKNIVVKNRRSLGKEFQIQNEEILCAVKEEVVSFDENISKSSKYGRLTGGRSTVHVQDNAGVLTRCSGIQGHSFLLGPNDSFATIKSIAASDSSEPIVVVVRNVDSDEPICEPVSLPSSRKPDSKLQFEIHKLEKINTSMSVQSSFLRKDSQTRQVPTTVDVTKMCLAEGQSLQCVVCGLDCPNRKTLIDHVKLHSTDRQSFECPTCKKTFAQQCNLRRHMCSHSGERPFSCQYCSKLFADQGYLNTHLRYHTNTKPYTCAHCNKSFFDRSNYVKHLKSHSGEKPYPCPICKKSFLQQSDLTRHKRVHSGERPFKCSYCERSFTQHGDLTTHLRHHTGERPYVCSDCQKTFANKRYLNSHVKGRICFKKKGNFTIASGSKEARSVPTQKSRRRFKKQ